nr:hypothetical protein [Tanacetum cinerariifolium]
MDCKHKLLYVAICLLLGSWSSMVIADQLCVALFRRVFQPCETYFKDGKTRANACCLGAEWYKKRGGTTNDRVALCGCTKLYWANNTNINGASLMRDLFKACNVYTDFPVIDKNFGCNKSISFAPILYGPHGGVERL